MRVFSKLLMAVMLLVFAVPLFGADIALTTHTVTQDHATAYEGSKFQKTFMSAQYSIADSLDWAAGAAGSDTLTMVLVPSMDIRGFDRVQLWAYLDGLADSWAAVDVDDSIFSVVAGDSCSIIAQVSPDGKSWAWITNDSLRTDCVMAATDTANVTAGGGPKPFIITLDREALDGVTTAQDGSAVANYVRLIAYLQVGWNEAVATTVNMWWKSGYTAWKE